MRERQLLTEYPNASPRSSRTLTIKKLALVQLLKKSGDKVFAEAVPLVGDSGPGPPILLMLWERRSSTLEPTGFSCLRRDLSGKFAFRGQPSLWRIFVHGIRQFARKSSEKFLLGQPGLPRQRIQNVGSDRPLQLDRGDGLVWSRSYPRFGGFAVAILLESIDKLREAATEDPTGGATGEITAELL